MKSILYHVIWVLIIVVAMVSTISIAELTIGCDHTGVKGATAAIAFGIIRSKKNLFKKMDKLYNKKANEQSN